MANIVKRTAKVYIDGKEGEKTLRGLSAESRKLRNELSHLPVESEEFRKKAKKLREVNKDLRSVRNEVKGTTSVFAKMRKQLGPLTGLMAGAFSGAALIGGIKKANELYREQAKAETALLTAVKGRRDVQQQLITQAALLQEESNFGDEEIIRNQALAASMGLTLDQINELIPAAADLSEVTGMSLDSSVRNLAKTYSGLAGELGESIPQLRNLSQEQLKAGEGIKVVAEAFKGQAAAAAQADSGVTQLKNSWGDFLEAVGGRFNGFLNGTNAAFKGMLETLTDMVGGVDMATQAYERQKNVVGDLEKNLNPLLNRYDELSGATDLTEAQQAELKDTIEKVAAIVPTAVTEFDEYGNALDINTTKAREFVGAQREILKLQNAELIEQQTEKLSEQERELEKLNHQLSQRNADGDLVKIVQDITKIGDDFKVTTRRVAMTGEEITDLTGKMRELRTATDDTRNSIILLEGGEIETGNSGGGDDGAEAERLARVSDLIKKAAQAQQADREGAQAKEIAAANAKYDNLKTQASGFTEQLAVIEGLRGQAIAEIQKKYAAKEVRQAQRLAEQVRAEREKAEAERVAAIVEQQEAGDELDAAIKDRRTNDVQSELELLMAKHETELELAAKHGENIAELALRQQEEMQPLLEELHQAEIDRVNSEFEDLYEIADRAGRDTTDLQRMHGETIQRMEEDFAAQSLETQNKKNREYLRQEQSRARAVAQVTGNLLSMYSDAMVAAGEDESTFLGFQKLAALYKIGLDTGEAISGLMNMSENNPANAVTGGLAGIGQYTSGLVRIFANVASAKRLLDGEPPSVPAYAVGGDTYSQIASGGVVPRPTYGWFGEQGPEWVAPNWMYSSPTLAPIFTQLENLRQTGSLPDFSNRSTSGSSDNLNADNWKQGKRGGDTGGGEMQAAVAQLAAVLGGGIKATVNYDLQQELNDRITSIKTGANLN